MSDSLPSSQIPSKPLPPELAELADVIRAAAQQKAGNCLDLLELLRMLESVHYEIRETQFREALPDNRQRLYRLLKDIEQTGGWPYIKRMRLLALLEHLDPNELDLDA